MSELVAKAKRMGVNPAEYAKRLIEDGLALAREAEGSSFAQIMKPVREAAGDVDDNEIISLVKTARADQNARGRRKHG
jgi:hypothetical protein